MKTKEFELRLERLTSHVTRLDKRLAMVEQRAGCAPRPQHATSVHIQPPWKMDEAQVEEFVAETYPAVKENPLEALNFEQPDEDSYLTAHAKNVSKLAMFLADKHGFSEVSTRTVGICGLLHDAGMDCLPHAFVSAGRPLTEEEYQQVRTHPTRGADYVRQHYKFGGLLASVVPAVVEQHHERTDGTGYPHGLAGNSIHDFARVLAIADSYEAMTTPRPFRMPRHPAEAMRALLLQGYPSPSGGMYDRGMLKTLVWSMSLYPVGCEVRLSDGHHARVLAATADPKRPVVKLLGGDHSGREVDLTEHEELTILERPHTAS